ncbi:hypothetical protein [Nonomuraea sp. NPDC050643]|uniref:hypothetical protein n=1 Tax=Nonomuraea sp. NPDC050643 TaxID=3155660 RepID=UPI0033CF61E7
MSMALDGDRQRLAVCLAAMTPDQLVEVADAARLLGAAASQALGGDGMVRDAAPAKVAPVRTEQSEQTCS